MNQALFAPESHFGEEQPLGGGDWAANSQTVFMPSYTPGGGPVILEVDQGGKVKVVLQGSRSIDFEAMIQSPDARYALVDEVIPTDNNAWQVNDL